MDRLGLRHSCSPPTRLSRARNATLITASLEAAAGTSTSSYQQLPTRGGRSLSRAVPLRTALWQAQVPSSLPGTTRVSMGHFAAAQCAFAGMID